MVLELAYGIAIAVVVVTGIIFFKVITSFGEEFQSLGKTK